MKLFLLFVFALAALAREDRLSALLEKLIEERVAAESLVWGGKNGRSAAESLVWGGKNGRSAAESLVWGGRNGRSAAESLVWGGRNGRAEEQLSQAYFCIVNPTAARCKNNNMPVRVPLGRRY